MKLAMTLTNSQESKWIKLELPASYSVLADTLERLGDPEAIHASGVTLDEYGRGNSNLEFSNCNIFELNYFAQMVDSFSDEQTHKMTGALFLMGENEVTLDKAINLTMNIQQNNIVDCQPALDEYDLAKFHLENELIATLENVSDDAYQWILDHTDYNELGKEIMENEGGTFISGNYVTMGELEELYDGSLRMPSPEPYIFRLQVGFCPEEDDGSVYTLPLPVDHSEIDRMMDEMEVESLSQLNCHDFKSIIPLLEPMDFAMTDIETLNDLASSIAHFKETGQLTTYKAMADALDVINLENAHQICDYVSGFDLKPSVRNANDYGKDILAQKYKGQVPEEILDLLNLESLGAEQMKKDGTQITEYGALIPKGGMTVMEKLMELEEQPQPQTHRQSFGMTMG